MSAYIIVVGGWASRKTLVFEQISIGRLSVTGSAVVGPVSTSQARWTTCHTVTATWHCTGRDTRSIASKSSNIEVVSRNALCASYVRKSRCDRANTLGTV